MGQKVQFSAVAKDGSGKPLADKPSTWFAAPFDLAKADASGMISFYEPGEVMIGAIVAGKPGFARVVVKPAAVKTIDLEPASSPLIVGGATKLNATARTFTGTPRSDVAIAWTSDFAETPEGSALLFTCLQPDVDAHSH